jgi:hypothetical protein
MPRRVVWMLLLAVLVAAATPADAQWGQRSRAAPREEQADDEAIIEDLDVLSELEMLQMLEILQELETLNEIDPGLLPGSEREGTVR